ncbi:MAG: 3-deoxy-D-manno-octulosonic acid transferase [Verrucomicrobia bacterium]|nr:3-deoxy-D-manno-octulosonic acid transferase [Verrucomicrobiota bacterium]
MFYLLTIAFYGVASILRAYLRRTGRSIRSYFDIGPLALEGPTVWIHAVSLGEAKAVIPLVERLQEHDSKIRIVISSVTETGHAEVKRSMPGVAAIYLPLDMRWLMERAVKKITPDLFLLSETDYWPALLRTLKKRGTPIVVVNGKLSASTAKWHCRLPWLRRNTLALVDQFCLQSEVYKERLEALGIAPERLYVTGNLKFDGQKAPLKPLELSLKKPILTIGSSHPEEEERLLRALSPLLAKGLLVLLVPRHPHRFDEVAKMVLATGWRASRYSEGIKGDERIIVVDQMGLLIQLYALSDVAIVAGSFTEEVGGHNLLEPIRLGVPTLFGPHMESQADMADLVLHYGAGRQVTFEEVAQEVQRALNEPATLQEGARRLLEATQGSVERTWEKMKRLVPKRG